MVDALATQVMESCIMVARISSLLASLDRRDILVMEMFRLHLDDLDFLELSAAFINLTPSHP